MAADSRSWKGGLLYSMTKAAYMDIQHDPAAIAAYNNFNRDPLTRKIVFMRSFEGDDWVKTAIQAMADEIYAEARNLKRFDVWWTVIPEINPEAQRAVCMLMIRPVEEETKH